VKLRLVFGVPAAILALLLTTACTAASTVQPTAVAKPASQPASQPTTAPAVPTTQPAAQSKPQPTEVPYPTKPITFLVGYAAGGDTDNGARVLASVAEKKLGQQMVVVNKAGASGQIAWTELANSKPDGYTLAFVNQPTMVSGVVDPERKTVYNVDSFEYIANQVTDYTVPYVRADSPYKSLKDLVDAAKAKPGTITLSTTGLGTNEHFGILKLQKAAGVQFRIVHLEGSAQAHQELLGGHVDVAVDNVGGWGPAVKGGEARPLFVMSPERSKFYPDVPCSAELGYPTVIMSSSRGVIAPKGLPAAVSKRLQDSLKAAMEDPEHVQKMENLGLATDIMVGDKYYQFTKEMLVTAKELMEMIREEQKK